MSVVGLDPGTHESAYVEIDSTDRVLRYGTLPNLEMLKFLKTWPGGAAGLVIEKVESYGMAVGVEVFDTVFWTGRFAQVWPWTFSRMGRKDVKMHLCGTMKAKDPHIRQALIDRYGPGKEKAIGVKKSPGPLYGLKGHEFAALAVAVTAIDEAMSGRTEQPDVSVRQAPKRTGSTEMF